jgi:hypothetical protein
MQVLVVMDSPKFVAKVSRRVSTDDGRKRPGRRHAKRIPVWVTFPTIPLSVRHHGPYFVEWMMNDMVAWVGFVRVGFRRRSVFGQSDGPYRYVRHPMYLGAMIFYPGMGFVLGSWWAMLPVAITMAAIVWRLVPGIW